MVAMPHPYSLIGHTAGEERFCGKLWGGPGGNCREGTDAPHIGSLPPRRAHPALQNVRLHNTQNPRDCMHLRASACILNMSGERPRSQACSWLRHARRHARALEVLRHLAPHSVRFYRSCPPPPKERDVGSYELVGCEGKKNGAPARILFVLCQYFRVTCVPEKLAREH